MDYKDEEAVVRKIEDFHKHIQTNLEVNNLIHVMFNLSTQGFPLQGFQKRIYTYFKSIILKGEPILKNENKKNRKRIIDEHYQNIEQYGLDLFYLNYTSEKKSDDVYDTSHIEIYKTPNIAIRFETSEHNSFVLINNNEYQNHVFNYDFDCTDIINERIPHFYQYNRFYEDCLICYLSFFLDPFAINDFLDNQIKYYKTKNEFNRTLRTLINEYHYKYIDLIPKVNLEQIEIWITENDIEIKETKSNDKTLPTEEMSPLDQKNQTYPKVPIYLINSQKVLLFIFTFYYRLNIKLPDKNSIAENMMILQAKKNSDRNLFEKILEKETFYYKRAQHKERDIKAVHNYLQTSDNEALIPLYNTFIKDYFLLNNL